jgi:hypothetical protein
MLLQQCRAAPSAANRRVQTCHNTPFARARPGVKVRDRRCLICSFDLQTGQRSSSSSQPVGLGGCKTVRKGFHEVAP